MQFLMIPYSLVFGPGVYRIASAPRHVVGPFFERATPSTSRIIFDHVDGQQPIAALVPHDMTQKIKQSTDEEEEEKDCEMMTRDSIIMESPLCDRERDHDYEFEEDEEEKKNDLEMSAEKTNYEL